MLPPPLVCLVLFADLFLSVKSVNIKNRMAGIIKRMSQIKQLLQMHRLGMGRKQIARALSVSKTTVKSYLDKVEAGELDIDRLLEMDDPLLQGQFHAGHPSYKDPRYLYLELRINHYVGELSRKGVTKHLLWQEYRQECIGSGHEGYAYTQFCYHLNQLMVARSPSAVLIHQPGEKLYVDYAGDKLHYIDFETGMIIDCPVFVASLPFSDYCFAMVCRNQSTEEFVGALVACLTHLGGVPRVLVPDNLKAAVIRANRYEPELNRVLEDFANHYGMAVVPARVSRPCDKALCENQVKLLYSRVYAHLRNRQFFDLVSLREAVERRVREHNQTRMQQKPWCRQERFLALEHPVLGALPDKPFQIKHYRWYTVDKSGRIYLSEDNHYYSVPYCWTGQKVQVIYTASLVSIYVRNECVATHLRDMTPGGYSREKEHLPANHRHWLERSPEYYTGKAGEKSVNLARLFECIFADNRPAEHHYRTCDGLLSLQRKTPADVFERAICVALENEMCTYRSVMNLIRNDAQNRQEQAEEKPLPQHSNVRGKEYYKQLNIDF
jgi:transposase